MGLANIADLDAVRDPLRRRHFLGADREFRSNDMCSGASVSPPPLDSYTLPALPFLGRDIRAATKKRLGCDDT
jgi:hypothetical protein